LTTARGSAAARPTKPEKSPEGARAKHRIVVPFDDNRLLAHLLGEYDSHLALIESRLGIEAHAHGNVITLTGPQPASEIGREVLNAIYDRVRKGETVTAGDIDGMIRLARSGTPRNDGTAQVRTRRRIVTARTPMQGTYIQALDRHDLVFGVGPAGTGKTYLAVAQAASYLERGLVERIVLSRPAVEAGERLGFLPGDMREKVDPYLRPLYDALYDVLPPEKVEKDLETGTIEIAPLAFMRGRTLAQSFVILDEAQNTTSMQMKMFLTRHGEGSRMVVTGDPTQIDLPPGQKSGLDEAVRLLEGVDGIEVVHFSGADVVRSELVARIVAAYDGAPVSSGLGSGVNSTLARGQGRAD
jgi:phosphate starvation-inducible PhoH-like protein